MRRIYLDYNATTPIAPSVAEAMQPFVTEHFGNPSSDHVHGRVAKHAVEEARGQVANLFGADAEEIVFTGGGSESINLAFKGVCFHPDRWNSLVHEQRGHLVISAIEHPATVAPANFLERIGFDVSVAKCDAQGVVSAAEIKSLIRDDTVLVSIMHANNETGVIQPIAGISAVCREKNILLHTDAAQSVGKIPARVDDLGVDLMSIAGHKLYAPKGVGALYVRRGVDLESLIHGADHEFGLRAGTENVPYVVGLGKAAGLAAKGDEANKSRLCELRDRLQLRLAKEIEGLTVNGSLVERLPNTLSVNFPKASGHEILARIPELCASTGAACHSGEAALSATLRAMGLSADTAQGTIRLSVGWPTSIEEVDKAGELLVESWRALT